jgi:hypothetical protein
MAKALFGHVTSPDHRGLALATELRRLRSRCAELETQLEQACRANEELHRQMTPLVMDDHDLLHLDAEPALTLT